MYECMYECMHACMHACMLYIYIRICKLRKYINIVPYFVSTAVHTKAAGIWPPRPLVASGTCAKKDWFWSSSLAMLRIHCYHRCCGTSSSINGDVTIKDLWLNHLKLQDHEARKGYVSDIVTTNGIFDRIIVIFDGIQKLNDRPVLEKNTWLTKRNQNSHFTDQISASPTDMPFLNLWQLNIAIKKIITYLNGIWWVDHQKLTYPLNIAI